MIERRATHLFVAVMDMESRQLSLLNSESTVTQEEEKSTAESECSFEVIETHLLRTRAHFCAAFRDNTDLTLEVCNLL